MYHICFTNPDAWEISLKNGIYGNVETGNNNEKTFWGKLVDLTALMPGDRIFFYIKERKLLAGLYEVTSEPFFCQDNLFQNSEETYPFRFGFKEIKHFENPIPSSELAKLIERGELYSLTTLERDQNASFRGIRQLTNNEGAALETLLLHANPKCNLMDLKPITQTHIKNHVEAREIIENVKNGKKYLNPHGIKFSKLPIKKISHNRLVAKYENCLQGYIYYCLRRDLNSVKRDLDTNNFTECLMEFPMLKAQQYRADILCLYHLTGEKPHFYTIIETKKEKTISITDLSQLIGYLKDFSAAREIPFSIIEGVYVSINFDEEAIKYLHNRCEVEKERPIRLIQYSLNENGTVTFSNVV